MAATLCTTGIFLVPLHRFPAKASALQPPHAEMNSSGPVLDYLLTGESVFSYNYSARSLMYILTSCLIAVCCPLVPPTYETREMSEGGN